MEKLHFFRYASKSMRIVSGFLPYKNNDKISERVNQRLGIILLNSKLYNTHSLRSR